MELIKEKKKNASNEPAKLTEENLEELLTKNREMEQQITETDREIRSRDKHHNERFIKLDHEV